MFIFSLLPVILSQTVLSPQTWIGDSLLKIANLTLRNFTIPGTHNSGTYYLNTVPMLGDEPIFIVALYDIAKKRNTNIGDIAIKWSKTQELTFYEQMQGGIRYFDLRCGWNSTLKEWVTFHFVQGSPIREILQNITKYLLDFPKEFVLVEMSHFEGFPTERNIRQLRKMVFDILGPLMYPVDYSLNFTIGQIVSSGKRAIVTMDSLYDNITVWSSDGLIHNTYANTPSIPEMEAFNNVTIEQFMDGAYASQMFKISWTLTANVTTIKDSLDPSKPQSLIALADSANKELPSFWTSIKQLGWRTGNILIIDHFETSEIMKVVWEMNGLA